MTLDKETIYGIVQSGKYTRAEAVILQGGEKLTKEQRQWWSEAQLLMKVEKDKRKERHRTIEDLAYGGRDEDGPMSNVERQRKHNLLNAAIDDVLDDALTRINTRRRKRSEASLLAFVKAYGTDEAAFLEQPPAKRMETILEEMQTAVDDSSVPYHIRVARGHGKTSYAKLATAWAVATGRRRFVIAVGSSADNAAAIVNDLAAFFTDSPRFAQDFPEISIPLQALGGVYQKAKSQTYRGKPTKIKIGNGQIVLPTVDGARSSGCIIRGLGFGSGARGLVRGKRRPDLLILDDLQSDDLADNDERVAGAVQHLKKTFLGLAGHRKKIAAIMTSTPIAPDDMSETFARDPAWKTTTHKMVLAWPSAWKTGNDATDLWKQYRDILMREITDGNKKPHIAANRFYLKHRPEMDAGAEVLDPTNYDRATERSGVQHAMNLLFQQGGEVFDSEYQMAPRRLRFAFEISPELVKSRVRRGVAPLATLDGTELVVVATDINPAYALTTTVLCFMPDRTALVTAYHITKIHIDDSENDTRYHAQVYDALCALARWLRVNLRGLRVDLWGIDAGGKQIDPVTRFVQERRPQELFGCGEAVALIGRAWRMWNDRPRNAVRNAANFTVPINSNKRRFTFWNADYWKEVAQVSWATEVGGPGGLSLCDGGVDHTEFALQVANERLKVKRSLGDRYAYEWKEMGAHDYGDCVAMCYALAATKNLTGTGQVRHKKNLRRTYNG